MRLTDWGTVGRLEAARQALDEAGSKGLSARQVMEAAGLDGSAGGGSTQHFLLKLTYYCAIYESDDGRHQYLNEEMDENFDRKIFIDEDIFKEDQDNE